MTEPFDRNDERLLRAAASAVAYPATPQLVSRVLAQIPANEQQARARQRRFVTVAAAAMLAAAVALTATMLVFRDVRQAVADFLGLAVPGEQISILPTAGPGVTPTALPTPRPLETIASPSSLADAEARLGFRPVVPANERDLAVYLADFNGVPAVVLRTASYDLWQFSAMEGFFGKSIFIGSTAVEELSFEGGRAYWITGGPRLVSFFDASGREVAGTQRTLSGHALVFARGSVAFRIEGDLSRDEALAAAASLR